MIRIVVFYLLTHNVLGDYLRVDTSRLDTIRHDYTASVGEASQGFIDETLSHLQEAIEKGGSGTTFQYSTRHFAYARYAMERGIDFLREHNVEASLGNGDIVGSTYRIYVDVTYQSEWTGLPELTLNSERLKAAKDLGEVYQLSIAQRYLDQCIDNLAKGLANGDHPARFRTKEPHPLNERALNAVSERLADEGINVQWHRRERFHYHVDNNEVDYDGHWYYITVELKCIGGANDTCVVE